MATDRGPAVRYGSAVAAVALATLIRRWLDPTLGEQSPFITYLVAIAFAAWFGGLRAALVALTLSGLSVAYFILSPHGSPAIADPAGRTGFALFVAAGLAIASLGWAMRAAQRRAEGALEAEREHRERLRVTLQSLADGIITTDARGKVTGMNPVAEHLTRW